MGRSFLTCRDLFLVVSEGFSCALQDPVISCRAVFFFFFYPNDTMSTRAIVVS